MRLVDGFFGRLCRAIFDEGALFDDDDDDEDDDDDGGGGGGGGGDDHGSSLMSALMCGCVE